MNTELMEALNVLEKEKNISKDILLEAVEAALITAYKKDYGPNQQIRVTIDRETGEIKILASKTVVEEIENDQLEMSLADAHRYSKKYEVGDVIEYDVTPKSYGRIAAQTAKQVVVQRIREAERDMVYDQFSSLEHELVTGVVRRIERRNVIVEIGSSETVLTPEEQVEGEVYQIGDRIKLYIAEVKRTTKGSRIVVSRSHTGLVKRLFETEVPEIHDGTVEIKSISRDPGSRTKLAVCSTDSSVDPIGACVGNRGNRVQTIVDELRGEKIDIINWDDNPAFLIENALSPAKVISVVADEDEKEAQVIVPDYQLSLAIGKEGQNVRLAAKLTGYKIDIKGPRA